MWNPCLTKVLKKNSNGTYPISHRPTWWRNSPFSQSLRAECPKISCMGGLAPGRQTHLTLPRIFCKLGGLWPILCLWRLNVAKSIYLDRLVVFHHCGYRCKSESISACVIMKSALNKIYPPIFLPVGLLVKFLNTNHINSFYGKFRIRTREFVSLSFVTIRDEDLAQRR